MRAQGWSERASQTLEKALGHLGTWALLGLVVFGVAVGAGIATHQAGLRPSAWAYGLYLFLLGSTLLAVLWYSLETRRLVRIQRDAAEIADHPWLRVEPWQSVDLAEGPGRPLGGILARLPIGNVGRTPAMLRDITVQYEVEPGSSQCTVNPGGDVNPRALAPGQAFLTNVAEIAFHDRASPTVYVDMVIGYDTIHGGSGRIELRFRYADRVWKSRETRYQCALSSGLTFPARREAAGDR